MRISCNLILYNLVLTIYVGLVVKEKNYLVVYIYEKWNTHTVPQFEEGEEFEPTVCEIRNGQTSKPNYLTEADLVTLMDKNGIGSLSGPISGSLKSHFS